MEYVIVGGGIIGSCIAREIMLRGYGKVTVLEKEKKLGEHASVRNSGVLHSGINQQPGTIKASMCLEGNKLARKYCKSHNVAIEECGTIVVAKNPSEEKVLKTLLGMGRDVGVRGLKIIDKGELKKHEPNVSGRKALLSPNGAIVDSMGFLESIASEAKKLGVRYKMGNKVINIYGNEVLTSKGEFKADHIINCAGLYADKVAHMMKVGLRYTIIPFRGEYVEIKGIPINSMVYQVPDLKYPFLGVHLTKTVGGKVLAGPTAVLSLGRESYNKEVNFVETFNMLRKINFLRLVCKKEFIKLTYYNARLSFSDRAFLREVCKILPQATTECVADYLSGIRAQIVDHKGNLLNDITIERTKNSTHIINAVSPGMTCALPFAKLLADNLPQS